MRRGAYAVHQNASFFHVDRSTAIFWAEHDEYRVSHPLGCGDDCIEFRYSDELIEESGLLDANSGARDRWKRIAAVPVADDVIFRFNVVASRLEMGFADEMETVESAIAILRETSKSAQACRFDSAARNNSKAARKKVERAKEIMLSDISVNRPLDDIARESGSSPFHLTRLFQQYAGATLHQYLMRQRLAAALDSILAGADNITEIALEFGFSSHSHFTAAFRKRYGVSPTAVRTRTDCNFRRTHGKNQKVWRS